MYSRPTSNPLSRSSACRAIAALGLALAVAASPALADQPSITLSTLIDRAQIEDMLVDYYDKTIPNSPGKVHVLLTNPRIVVNGHSATADLIWTEVYYLR